MQYKAPQTHAISNTAICSSSSSRTTSTRKNEPVGQDDDYQVPGTINQFDNNTGVLPGTRGYQVATVVLSNNK